MKNFVTIILVGLVILNIVDGDFKNPSMLDIAKFILLGVCIVLSILKDRKG